MAVLSRDGMPKVSNVAEGNGWVEGLALQLLYCGNVKLSNLVHCSGRVFWSWRKQRTIFGLPDAVWVVLRFWSAPSQAGAEKFVGVWKVAFIAEAVEELAEGTTDGGTASQGELLGWEPEYIPGSAVAGALEERKGCGGDDLFSCVGSFKADIWVGFSRVLLKMESALEGLFVVFEGDWELSVLEGLLVCKIVVYFLKVRGDGGSVTVGKGAENRGDICRSIGIEVAFWRRKADRPESDCWSGY